MPISTGLCRVCAILRRRHLSRKPTAARASFRKTMCWSSPWTTKKIPPPTSTFRSATSFLRMPCMTHGKTTRSPPKIHRIRTTSRALPSAMAAPACGAPTPRALCWYTARPDARAVSRYVFVLTQMVAAYLMWSRSLTVVQALALIRRQRPMAEPNEGFLRQYVGCALTQT